MSQNPDWTRDEHILGLDLYFKVNPLQSTHRHPDVRALSELLNSLPFHPRSKRQNNFRNPVGVYMTLRTYLRWDPSYSGKGLAGGKLGKQVWDEFAGHKARLTATADAIRNSVSLLNDIESSPEIVSDDDVFPEGRILSILHRMRERNSALVKRKKEQVLRRTGKLACEICDFDFKEKYGPPGAGFAECHHLVPLCELASNRLSKLSDLAIVCANCHRILHRVNSRMNTSELRDYLKAASVPVTVWPRSLLEIVPTPTSAATLGGAGKIESEPPSSPPAGDLKAIPSA